MFTHILHTVCETKQKQVVKRIFLARRYRNEVHVQCENKLYSSFLTLRMLRGYFFLKSPKSIAFDTFSWLKIKIIYYYHLYHRVYHFHEWEGWYPILGLYRVSHPEPYICNEKSIFYEGNINLYEIPIPLRKVPTLTDVQTTKIIAPPLIFANPTLFKNAPSRSSLPSFARTAYARKNRSFIKEIYHNLYEIPIP